MRQLFWSTTAWKDRDSIHDYISRDSLAYANAVVSGIMMKAQQAVAQPESGRIVREDRRPSRKELIHGNYRIVYDIEDERIIVLSVLHGRRQRREVP